MDCKQYSILTILNEQSCRSSYTQTDKTGLNSAHTLSFIRSNRLQIGFIINAIIIKYLNDTKTYCNTNNRFNDVNDNDYDDDNVDQISFDNPTNIFNLSPLII